MPYPQFDRSKLLLKPLSERDNDLDLSVMVYPDSPYERIEEPAIEFLAEKIVAAHKIGAPVVMMLGAHVLRRGNTPLLVDLMERGYLNHISLNGAGAIHDFELALIGETTESVARYISEGQFGLWKDTGRINDIMGLAAREGIGLGEALGRTIYEGDFPHKKFSLLANAYRLQVPVTIHISIGQDIIHEHPNVDGAALGASSYNDFLVFAETIRHLEGGVLLNIGTAVMGPEVYLKALSMSRNVAHQHGEKIAHFATGVFDLQDLGDIHHEAPRGSAAYYYRPYKTILVRTVQDGGESVYVRGDHKVTVPNLYHRIIEAAHES
ncbi:MAG: hypothetical protein LWX83_04985 [Anaerolineae bacterium]|nr:hypothetical protein [Anaerolineae bacterium]